MRLFEMLFMSLYRRILTNRTHRERLEALGTCDTFDFKRHGARAFPRLV
jgi:hypothetical protein